VLKLMLPAEVCSPLCNRDWTAERPPLCPLQKMPHIVL
jgi:hypothetical protein